jgi:hypothetical protein
VFCIISCIGNSSAESSIKNAPWIRAKGDSFTLWLGTHAFVFEDLQYLRKSVQVNRSIRCCGFCTTELQLLVSYISTYSCEYDFSVISERGKVDTVQQYIFAAESTGYCAACVRQRTKYHGHFLEDGFR